MPLLPLPFMALLPSAAWLLAGLLGTSSAQDTVSLSRKEAIQRALHHHPQLSVAAVHIERARSQWRWAGRMDNPELALAASTDQFGLNEEESTLEVAFSQRFPLTSRLRDEKRVRRFHIDLAQAEFETQQRQVAYAADQAWIEARFAQAEAQLRRRLLDQHKEIVTFLQASAALGETSSLDAAQAALQGQALSLSLGQALKEAEQSLGELKRRVGLSPDVTLSLQGSLPFPAKAPPSEMELHAVLLQRPDYRSLVLLTDLGQAEYALAKSQRWDDVVFKIFAESDRSVDEPAGIERQTLAGIGLSIPLPLRTRNEAALEAAQLAMKQARRRREAKLFEIRSELRNALNARHSAYALLIAVTDEILPAAQANFQDFRKAQQAGQVAPLQVREAESQLLHFETTALERQKAYALEDAKLHFLSRPYPLPLTDSGKP